MSIFYGKEIKKPMECFESYFTLSALHVLLLIYCPNLSEKHWLFGAMAIDS